MAESARHHVARAGDRPACVLVPRAAHRGAGVEDDLRAGDGGVDGGGVAKVAEHDLDPRMVQRPCGGRAMAERAYAPAAGDEALDEPAPQAAARSRDQDVGGGAAAAPAYGRTWRRPRGGRRPRPSALRCGRPRATRAVARRRRARRGTRPRRVARPRRDGVDRQTNARRWPAPTTTPALLPGARRRRGRAARGRGVGRRVVTNIEPMSARSVPPVACTVNTVCSGRAVHDSRMCPNAARAPNEHVPLVEAQVRVAAARREGGLDGSRSRRAPHAADRARGRRDRGTGCRRRGSAVAVGRRPRAR